MRKVWIDSDLGFDDVVAVAMLASAADVEIAGMSLVAGNATLPQIVRNARDAAGFFGWSMPIFAGLAKPLCSELVTAASVLGETALPTRGRTLPRGERPIAEAAAGEALARYLESGGAEILALGPLTNIAALLIGRPDLADRIGRLVWMGGSAGPGNHSAVAEFNAAVDPEAVQAVIAAGVTISMVGLDACRPVRLSAADAARLRGLGGERAEIVADLLDGYIGIGRHDGRDAHPVYDAVAAAAWLAPELVAFRPARLDMELAGRHTRGMTVVEWRVPRKALANAEIATTPEIEPIRALMLRALERAATPALQAGRSLPGI